MTQQKQSGGERSTEMDELIAFIRARLDEKEAAAREAGGPTGHWVAEDAPIGVVLVNGEPLIEGHITGLTEHIALHDPARVLREVAAKRARLERYLSAVRGAEKWRKEGGSPAVETILLTIWREIREDAAIWNDHPAYRPEWAVE